MKVPLLLLSAAIAVSVAVIAYHRPYLRSARILEADAGSEAIRYAHEFADSLKILTHGNTGKALPQRYIHLAFGDDISPDQRFTLQQRSLRNAYHEITLLRNGDGVAETVLVLQEGDPGSGTSHDYRWSSDSKAVFIYGSGRPAGHAHTNALALIYLFEARTLYSVDLDAFVAQRLKAMRNGV